MFACCCIIPIVLDQRTTIYANANHYNLIAPTITNRLMGRHEDGLSKLIDDPRKDCNLDYYALLALNLSNVTDLHRLYIMEIVAHRSHSHKFFLPLCERFIAENNQNMIFGSIVLYTKCKKKCTPVLFSALNSDNIETASRASKLISEYGDSDDYLAFKLFIELASDVRNNRHDIAKLRETLLSMKKRLQK